MKLQIYFALLLCLCSRRVQAKAVFAHFMVGNVYTWGVSNWESDMILAQEAHIDAFALNIEYGNIYNAPSLSNAFQAAAKVPGFKLFFSFDYNANGSWPQSNVTALLKEYGPNAGYYQYGGGPLVSTFQGSDNYADWAAIKKDTGCFFIPCWSSLGAEQALALGEAQGLMSWAAWPYGPDDMYTIIDASYFNFLNGTKPYIMPVSPWFFTNLPGYTKAWLWRGDSLWFDRWQQVLSLDPQPDFVEILTWNDYGESHYIGPLHTEEYDLFTVGQAPFNYVTEPVDMQHDGWRQFLPYLIDTWKNGIAPITNEGVVGWYRLQPATACNSYGITGNTISQEQCMYNPTDMVQDEVFYAALLTSLATVTVTKHVPVDFVGLYRGSVPFNGDTGAVKIAISRSGAPIASFTGAAITTDCSGTKGFQNFNAWVGYAYGPALTPAVEPPLAISQQNCTQGKGLGNYEGLCVFCCENNYCPVGTCTCTAMGTSPTIPKIVDQSGYLIAGEDASYDGLCRFACNHNYCPPAACSQVSVPLSPPPTSGPFPVCTLPGCIEGTGPGNYLGLCSYSCARGYCPEPCVCTAIGDVPTQQLTIGQTGCPVSGLDYTYVGLCEYTCSHGYCPPGACYYVPLGTICPVYSSVATTTTTNPYPCTWVDDWDDIIACATSTTAAGGSLQCGGRCVTVATGLPHTTTSTACTFSSTTTKK